jgi:plastocyanin
MPGPSPWPFFAPIAVTLMLFGVIFSSILILGGLILAFIAVGGWFRDAWREWQSTEEVGHVVPATRDPVKAWPRRLVPIFVGVIAISFLVALAPLGLSYLNSLTPASAGPTPVGVPAVPEISASTATSFEVGTLVVPAGRPFDLIFHNKQEGVPHNVELADSSARATVFFEGERIDGVADITYKVPAIDEGDFYFLCSVHPNMNGTLQVRPETGGPQPGGSPAGGPGAPPLGSPAP